IGEMVRVSVIDTGTGIPDTALPHIFDRFQQAEHDTDKIYGGTGLGLDISKQLTELHDGTMTVTSEVGSGSTFSFTLPIASDQSAATPSSPRRTLSPLKVFDAENVKDAPETPSILLVAGDPQIRAQVGQSLESSGYLLLDAESRPQAMDMASAFNPDLIIL